MYEITFNTIFIFKWTTAYQSRNIYNLLLTVFFFGSLAYYLIIEIQQFRPIQKEIQKIFLYFLFFIRMLSI